MATNASLAGLAFLMFFAITQAVRDAFFGHIFQFTSFFIVALLAFGSMALVFGSFSAVFRKPQLRILFAKPALFWWLNATTAVAWMGYFFALTYAEPAVVTTIYTGIGPLAVLVLAAVGVSSTGSTATTRLERVGYVGVGVSLIALATITIAGFSGMAGQPVALRVAAVLAAAAGGIIITVSHLIARTLNDAGVGSDTLTGWRFLIALGAAAVGELWLGTAPMRPAWDALPMLLLAAFLLIAIPSFSIQLGIARTSPLAVNVMRALGPVFVFGVQQFDGRLAFSGPTLVGISCFVIAALLAFVLRALAETRSH